MSRIDELIAQHCPEGVEFETLGAIAQTIPGLTGKTKADFSGGNARYVSYKNAFANLAVDQSANDFVAVASNERQNRLHLGDVVITGSSESLDEVGLSSVVDAEPSEPLYLNSFCFALRFDDPGRLLPGFAKYLMRSDPVRVQIRRAASGVTRINISKPRFLKVRIPVPPLEVQREIVRILDQFTQLEAELEAELEARARQYEHYKSALLAARGNAESVAIADHIAYVRGLTYSKADEVDSASAGIAVLRSNNIDLGSNRLNFDDVRRVGTTVRTRPDQWLKRDDILLSAGSGSRAHVGKAAFITDDMDYTFGGFMAAVRANGGISPRYLYHHLTSSRFRDYLDATIASTTINNLTRSIVGAFTVPLIDIDEQERVAALLDAFDALTNDLSVGLPAELAARRKQYEHYRDRLLTFEEATA